jgi:hypothetical protein
MIAKSHEKATLLISRDRKMHYIKGHAYYFTALEK